MALDVTNNDRGRLMDNRLGRLFGFFLCLVPVAMIALIAIASFTGVIVAVVASGIIVPLWASWHCFQLRRGIRDGRGLLGGLCLFLLGSQVLAAVSAPTGRMFVVSTILCVGYATVSWYALSTWSRMPVTDQKVWPPEPDDLMYTVF